MTTTTTLADALVATLADWDSRYVFGVSGANIEHLHDALHRDGRVRSVMARSEVGAAFMADARARVHRTLGVCCATSGGAMMNLAVGLAESYAESVPVLGIVGQVPTTMAGRGGFQDGSGIGRTVDAVAMFRAFTKYVARITDAARFWSSLEEAVTAALSGRPGPAVLLVPRDLWSMPVGARPAGFPTRLESLRAPATLGDTAGVERLFAALRDARRPVLVIGTGVDRCSVPDEVRRFAVDAAVPVVTTMGSSGAFPHDDPLFLGVVGAAGHPSAHAYLNDEADLVVAVGTGLDAMTRGPIARGLGRAPIAVVNIDAGQVRRAITPALVVEADAGLVFARLNARLAEQPFRHAPVRGYERRRYLTPPVATPRRQVHGDALRSSVAVELLQRYLPERGHIVFDAGNCAATALHLLAIRAGTSTTIALGQGGMGYAIAAATGAQLGSDREERTIVVCGDGAFLMLGTEIHTAVDLGLRALFVVFNDNQHGMCVTRQRLYFDARLECSRYGAVDVAGVARGLGGADRLWVGRAASPAQLLAQLAAYHADGGARPGVLEVRLLREEMPPFAPFLGEDAETCAASPPWNPARVSSAAERHAGVIPMAEDEFDALKLDNQVCFPLYAASRLIVQAYRPYLERLGITYLQYLTLMVLWEKDGSTVSEIGERLMLDSGTLTPVLKRLETDGVIKRRRNRDDDRVVENWLTARGRTLKRRAVDIPTQLLCSTTVELDEVSRLKSALAPVLEKLVAHQK